MDVLRTTLSAASVRGTLLFGTVWCSSIGSTICSVQHKHGAHWSWSFWALTRRLVKLQGPSPLASLPLLALVLLYASVIGYARHCHVGRHAYRSFWALTRSSRASIVEGQHLVSRHRHKGSRKHEHKLRGHDQQVRYRELDRHGQQCLQLSLPDVRLA